MQEYGVPPQAVLPQGTGSHEYDNDVQIVSLSFDRYVVTVKLSSSGQLLEILSIRVNKQFLSFSQRLAALQSTGFHDVEQFYSDSEDEA